MKVSQVIMLVSLIMALLGAGFIINKVMHFKNIRNKEDFSRCTVVFWNKSDQDVHVIVRPRKEKAQDAQVPRGSRGCFFIRPKEEKPDLLKYIAILYRTKKYRITTKKLLYSHFSEEGAKPVRYFDLMMIDAESESWATLKAYAKEHDLRVDERFKYLVVSNHPKLSTAFDSKAIIQLIKLRVFKVNKK